MITFSKKCSAGAIAVGIALGMAFPFVVFAQNTTQPATPPSGGSDAGTQIIGSTPIQLTPSQVSNITSNSDVNSNPGSVQNLVNTATLPNGSAASVPVVTSPAATGNCASSDGFVSLSCVPGFASAEQSNSLATFFNTIYQLCIGIAAVIAVIQITRAGILYMGSDSVGNKTYAKELIQMSVIGLVLVLAPVLIFGIINKNILSLKLNGLDQLNITPSANPATVNGVSSSCTGTNGTQGSCSTGQTCTIPAGQTQGTCGPAVSSAGISGTYLQKLTTSDVTQQQAFINACQSPNILINSCQTTDTKTGQPNCTGVTTFECEHYASRQYIYLGILGGADQAVTFQALGEVLSSSDLVPAISSELTEQQQFASTCATDGGKICATDDHISVSNLLGGDYITCPDSSQLISYSVPNGQEADCFKFAPFCADPSIGASACNSSWNIKVQ